jgi:hypothetical protein
LTNGNPSAPRSKNFNLPPECGGRSLDGGSSRRERKLILKHGYPFDDFEAALRASEKKSGSVSFELSPFYFEHLLGELARSENHTSSRSLAAELSELYEGLQAIASAHGLPIY